MKTDLAGLNILVVEDEFLIASDIESTLIDLGCTVVGPVPTVAEALLAVGKGRIDGAILDVNVDGEFVYPVADVLRERGVPIVFATGYGDSVLDERYRDVPTLAKPFNQKRLSALTIATFTASRQRHG